MRFPQEWTRVPTWRTLTALASEIEAEPMFFNAGQDLVERYGGVLTRQFIDGLRRQAGDLMGDRWSLDTRSHMLMRGWYPAIPGWHHDDVDRGENGQPNYDADVPTRQIYATVVDADDQPTGSMTEFLAGVVSVPWPVPDDAPVYRYWDHHIETDAQNERRQIRTGEIVQFSTGDFHRAMPAKRPGWRWFARITLDPGQRPVGGKIRRQAQVYLPVTNQGW